MTARDLIGRLELRERLAALVDELHVADGDLDVPTTLAEGLLEELDRLLEQERFQSMRWRVRRDTHAALASLDDRRLDDAAGFLRTALEALDEDAP